MVQKCKNSQIFSIWSKLDFVTVEEYKFNNLNVKTFYKNLAKNAVAKSISASETIIMIRWKTRNTIITENNDIMSSGILARLNQPIWTMTSRGTVDQ